MCGIAGWFSPAQIPQESRLRLAAMVDAIAHRGPDGRGELIIGHAALGHARLAIIDLDGGLQPMTSCNGKATIVFNGEIYNYPELRNDLTATGAVFRTHSDTEVILELYLRDGVAGFARLRGMYAFALWDALEQRALLVRDPCGIKPLFISKGPDGCLCFASEAKAILARLPETRPMLDEGALHLLMNFRYLPGARSLFRGIDQVPPGGVVEWRPSGKVNTMRLPAIQVELRPIIDALSESVRAHFTADVEVGAYLSGGIDSALVTHFGRNHAGSRLRTFTLDIGDDPNEARNAAESARLLGVDNYLGHAVPDNLTETLSRLTWHLELPKINALQVSLVARHAAQHVKVAISGLGGDELFYGYNAHRILWQAQRARVYIPDALTHPTGYILAELWRRLSRPAWTETERALRMLADLGNWPRIYGLLRNVWDTPRLRRLIYGPRMLDHALPDAFEVLEEGWPKNPDPVAAMAEYEWREKMVNDLLWQEDRASMAVGLEVRVPFVDVHVKETVWALGRDVLMPRGIPKGYLRTQLAGILPESILNRPKSGFQVDAGKFFHGHLMGMAQEWLSPDKLQHYGLFNPRFVAMVLAHPPHTRLRWHYFMLYLMLTTHLWLSLFEDSA